MVLACAPLAALEPCGDGSSATAALREDWDAAENWAPGEWQVRSLDAGRRIREGCAAGVVEAPLQAVRRVISAAAEFDEFMPRVILSEVELVSPGVYLNAQVLDLPFPLRDRRYTVRVESGRVEAGGASGWQARWTYVEGSGNIRDSRGSWTLIPLDAERTVVVYRVFTDPGGSLPAWVVDLAGPTTLRRLLDAVRARVLAGCAACEAPRER